MPDSRVVEVKLKDIRHVGLLKTRFMMSVLQKTHSKKLFVPEPYISYE